MKLQQFTIGSSVQWIIMPTYNNYLLYRTTHDPSHVATVATHTSRVRTKAMLVYIGTISIYLNSKLYA